MSKMIKCRTRGGVIWSHKLRPPPSPRALKSTFSSPQHQVHLHNSRQTLVPRTSPRAEHLHSAPISRPSDAGSAHPLFKYSQLDRLHRHPHQQSSSSIHLPLSSATPHLQQTHQDNMPANAPLKPLVAADSAARADNVSQTTTLYGGRTASHSLHIAVVGCGLGGLAAAHALAKAGHRITILEDAPAIGEVGAGIQVSPNLSRLLIRWGLGDALDKIAVMPEGIEFRRWQSGQKLGYAGWGQKFADEYGAPYYHIHRADFHRLLYDLTIGLKDKVTLRLKSHVSSIDADAPSCKLASGEVINCDLIIGADGVKSTIRQAVVGRADNPVPTGDAAYRAIVPSDKLLADPELAELVENPRMVGWLGPGRHIMAYCIRAKREFNMVLLHPDDGSVESWQAEGSADKMRADFEGWDPKLQKILSFVPSTLKWKLMDRKPLETWIHPSGKVALLGDACHPMLPYRAQGAAMAVEDGAVLGNLFSRLSHPSQIAPLLYAYETLRLPRTAQVQASSRLNQYIFHLEDGAEQVKRDSEMQQAMHGEEGLNNPNQWADKRKTLELMGYDADKAVDEWWAERGEKEIGRLAKAGEKKTAWAQQQQQSVEARLADLDPTLNVDLFQPPPTGFRTTILMTDTAGDGEQAISHQAPGPRISPRKVLESLSALKIPIDRIKSLVAEAWSRGGNADVIPAELEFASGPSSAVPLKEPQHVAVKKLRFADDSNDARALAALAHEVHLLNELSHDNIIKVVGFVEDAADGVAWIVLPWEKNGNLREFVASAEWEFPE
ncbi:hypothetical protein FRB90_006426, partial [Tulasnella sp. 427]